MSDTEKLDDSQDHSWFKRPELFVPQWVVGYARQTQHLSRWSWDQHERLETWQSTEGSSFQILSINVADEVVRRGAVHSYQIGISILDTDRLGDALAKTPEPDVNVAANVIQSHHWVVGDEEYDPKFEDLFRFGKMRYLSKDKLHEQITDIVEHRNFILISHGPDKSLSYLKDCGVHFEVLETIDTEKVVQDVLQVPADEVGSKDALIKETGVECQDPVLAGNAAHLTLRILLMLIQGDVDRHPHRKGVPMDQWSLLLQRIVNSPSKKRKLRRIKRSPSDSAQQIKNTSIAS
ncbi:QDE-2-interacting protein [Fusarium phyllophilum]|uniref:QDE-2-interacting protein n=1 Tax=Fusarium phyllophilum TaxID=47803 RepID=A0A8H5IFU7_9HYPO|nr:QDE-2-interacting protein [Fusarium phyllophilum]